MKNRDSLTIDALMMHGADWRGEDLAGWWLSEKFHGCRAWWDGARLWSRGGIPLEAPSAMLEELPAIALDCELYAGRGRFVDALRACSGGRWSEDLHLMVFDAPGCGAPAWIDRPEMARKALGRVHPARAQGRGTISLQLRHLGEIHMKFDDITAWDIGAQAINRRLKIALEFDGALTASDQVRRLSAAAGVAHTTARRWLYGGKPHLFSTFERCARGLDVSFDWLAAGYFHVAADTPERHALVAGMDAKTFKVVQAYLRMPDWEKSKFMRFLLRKINNDRKAERLGKMVIEGKISRHQLLRAM